MHVNNIVLLPLQENPIALDWINQNMYWIDTDPAGLQITLLSMQTQKYTRIIGGLDNPSDITISPEEGYKYVAGEKIQYNSDIHLCNFEKLHDCNGDSKYLRPLSNPELQQLQNIIRLSTS